MGSLRAFLTKKSTPRSLKPTLLKTPPHLVDRLN
jgi:hypothetical protein